MPTRYKVPPELQVRVRHQSVRSTAAKILHSAGVPVAEADEAADVLVTADVRGVDSHGVSNHVPLYMEYYGTGALNPRPNWSVSRETRSTATIDADKGLGIALGRRAMQIAVDKAKDVGMGVVTMSNSGHLGAVGHFSMIAAEQDMIGMTMTCGGMLMAPTFGAEARFGTNPIGVAAPANKEPPFLFDAATSSVAYNKILLIERLGLPVPAGWLTDEKGTPIMEETEVPPLGKFMVPPVGSTREIGSHKGYGLATMVEILTALLSGMQPSMVEGYEPGAPHRNYFAAYDIAAFSDVDVFKENMDQMLRTLRETKPAPGEERVLYPGMLEHEAEIDRLANGIPLHHEIVTWLDTKASVIGAPPLERS